MPLSFGDRQCPGDITPLSSSVASKKANYSELWTDVNVILSLIFQGVSESTRALAGKYGFISISGFRTQKAKPKEFSSNCS